RSARPARSRSARCPINSPPRSARSPEKFAPAIAVSYAPVMAAKPKTIKVCLTNRGEDSETPWAHDLGAAPGGRKVRLVNVPFLHAKPTWGDVIVVAPNSEG